MTSSAVTALRFHDLTLGYDRHPAVHHLDGSVEQGSLTAVVGPNGAGKRHALGRRKPQQRWRKGRRGMGRAGMVVVGHNVTI